jgi:hypothetical protein
MGTHPVDRAVRVLNKCGQILFLLARLRHPSAGIRDCRQDEGRASLGRSSKHRGQLATRRIWGGFQRAFFPPFSLQLSSFIYQDVNVTCTSGGRNTCALASNAHSIRYAVTPSFSSSLISWASSSCLMSLPRFSGFSFIAFFLRVVRVSTARPTGATRAARI